MKRTLQVVPASKIKVFLADREFIGKERFRFLRDRDVPFCIRIRKDTTVEAGSGTWAGLVALQGLAGRERGVNGRTETHGTIRALSNECRVYGHEGLHLVGTRYVGLEGKAEYLPLWTNSNPEEAIHRYCRRWEIETLFGALKSRGSRLEATHQGPATAQIARPSGIECFSVRPGPPSPIAAPRGQQGGSLRALSQAPKRASTSFVGYVGRRPYLLSKEIGLSVYRLILLKSLRTLIAEQEVVQALSHFFLALPCDL